MTKKDILKKHSPSMENILLLLHDFQNLNPRNFLSETDLALVARYLNTTYSSIYGVASYYSMFSLAPRGKHIIRICHSPVCHMAGVLNLFSELSTILKVGVGQTTPDGLFTWETTACLGQCDKAPAMLVDQTVYGKLTEKKIRAVLEQYKLKRGPVGRKTGR
jgi:NADH:ubiquinone oxidoreductase subunit E